MINDEIYYCKIEDMNICKEGYKLVECKICKNNKRKREHSIVDHIILKTNSENNLKSQIFNHLINIKEIQSNDMTPNKIQNIRIYR